MRFIIWIITLVGALAWGIVFNLDKFSMIMDAWNFKEAIGVLF